MNLFKRILITLWLIVSLVGIIASFYGIVQIWVIRPAIIESTDELLTNGVNILNSTDQAIVIINDALENIADSLNDLQNSTALIEESIHNTASMSGTFKVLLEEDFTVMTVNTLLAIKSSQQSATVIDATLEALSKVPFFGIPYNPETSLSFALGRIANELQDMPEILVQLAGSMDSTSENLYALETQVTEIADNLDEMQITMKEALVLAEDYQVYASDAKANLETIHNRSTPFINTIAWAATLLCLLLISSLVSAVIHARMYLTEK